MTTQEKCLVFVSKEGEIREWTLKIKIQVTSYVDVDEPLHDEVDKILDVLDTQKYSTAFQIATVREPQLSYYVVNATLLLPPFWKKADW